MRTPNTAVTTRFALMIVCERNNGIRRAETMLPRKPTTSSTIPAMNVGVSAAAIVEPRGAGRGDFGPLSVARTPNFRTTRAVSLQNRRGSVANTR